jgi:type II secretory pathway component PulM
MNLPAVVAMVGLGLLVVNEVFTAWNVSKFKEDTEDFKAAVGRKARYRNIVLGVTFLCAAVSVYSSIADKAERDAGVATLKARLQQTDDQVKRLAAAASSSAAASAAGASDPHVAQLQEQIRRFEAGTAQRAEVQELRNDLKELSTRLDVVETVLKRFEK